MTIESETLFLEYREGDIHAFKNLYNLHRAKLYRFLIGQLGNKALAEELFLNSWRDLRHASKAQASQPFNYLLYSIAYRLLLDHYRKTYGTLPTSFNDDYFPKRKKPQLIQIRNKSDAICGMTAQIRMLPSAQRAIFLLHAEAGLTIYDIACCTNIKREIVKSRLRHALFFLDNNFAIGSQKKSVGALRLYQVTNDIHHPSLALSHKVLAEALKYKAPIAAPFGQKPLIRKAGKMTNRIVKRLVKNIRFAEHH